MKALSSQELHNLAMNIAGEDLQEKGFEFLSINSKMKRNPQFVALKDRQLYFVVVRAVLFPDNPEVYDSVLLQTLKQHALQHKAELLYAGVGIANAAGYKLPVYKNEAYVVNYPGIRKI